MIGARLRGAARACTLTTALLAAACGPTEEIAVIEVADYGTIKLRFFPDEAPNHVANFKKLAREHFYDGTTFHRVAPGFMIQGGDPNSRDADIGNDGLGHPGYTLDAELNDIPHREGIVSMAHGDDLDSAGSQFFIVLRDHEDWKDLLDGKYTVFGEVIEGIEIARQIAWAKKDTRNRPIKPVVMTFVRLEGWREGGAERAQSSVSYISS